MSGLKEFRRAGSCHFTYSIRMRLDGLPSFSVCVNPQLITRAVTVPSLRLRLFTQIRVAGCVGSL